MRFNRLCATLIATALSVPEASLAQDAVETIRMGYVASVDQVSTTVGINNGSFDKQGIDLQLAKPFPTGVDILNAMQTGALDIATVGLPFIGAALTDMDVVVVGFYTGSASETRADNSYAMVAGPKSGIDPKNLQSLKGKKIGVTVSSTNELYAYNMLEMNNMTADSVEFINTAPGDMAVALQTNGVDAIASWEPWPSVTESAVEGSYQVVRGGGYVPNVGYIVARGDFVRDHPELVSKFLTAHAEASFWTRKNADEAADIIALWYPKLDPNTIKVATKFTAPLLSSRMSECIMRSIEEQADFVIERRKLSPGEKEKVLARIDPKFALAIQKNHPDFYGDLPAIPSAAQLKEDGSRPDPATVGSACDPQ